MTTNKKRKASLGQDYKLTPIDRFGIWLSARWVKGSCGNLSGKHLADIGCGHRAEMGRYFLTQAEHISLVDVSISDDLAAQENASVYEGQLPAAMAPIAAKSQDVVICNSVIEHLWEPDETIFECFRILKEGGTFLINVPSWRGKQFLEFSGFTLGLSTAEEIDDHKTYYDPKDLWPLLIRAGFRPRNVKCQTHKFGLNTYAVCKKN